ncbi:HD-GYP domain-containing protein [Anaerovorax odorimutans]|uniref:HD-GYP domain-containing protein n=1 Tax=Anaerovorax odorimutans TaxID=109327 RepID=UPI000416B36C|nr:HD domain-containing phosphohydrolase [Anaerovorax odorimutans]
MKEKELALDLQLLFFHDLIESIVAALEAKDKYTAKHSCRVSDMTEQLCSFMNLDKTESEIIHMAAHVHDIGKIGIPDSILLKPERLSLEEWEVMKTHPEIGANILNKSSSLQEISKIVLHHHERWDGNGYPHGLLHEAIPLGSRIIAICDSIDAMLSYRSYKKALTEEECKLEIIKNSGKMYDPKIIECLLLNWYEMIKHYKDSSNM